MLREKSEDWAFDLTALQVPSLSWVSQQKIWSATAIQILQKHNNGQICSWIASNLYKAAEYGWSGNLEKPVILLK